MNILFLENHALFATTVIEQFLGAHEVVVASSVAQGVSALESGSFDVALVDYDLDDAKGDVFVRHIRDAGFELPIVGVSARKEGNEALIECGADAVCHKQGFARIEEAMQQAIDLFRQTPCRIHFDGPQSGWLRVRLEFGQDRFDFDGSYTPRDSICELLDAIRTLGAPIGYATVVFHAEPEAMALRLDSRGGLVELTLERYPSLALLEGNGKVLLRTVIAKEAFVREFARAFRALLRVCPVDVYEREWRHAFPERAWLEIASTTRTAANTNPA